MIRANTCIILFLTFHTLVQAQKTENLFLVTFDGLRWEELFSGADPELIADLTYVKDTSALLAAYWDDDPMVRRQRLLPFFWSTLSENGAIYGNRNLENKVNCSNIFWFSYPGYGEILGGKTNAQAIHSNEKIQNPDTTFLEYLNMHADFQGKVAAFASWDVFPYIINEERSKVPVNAGFEKAKGDLSLKESFLNELQDQIPSPWSTVRLDAFTHNFTLEYLDKHLPRVVYISYGETDDFAHDGRYDHYLNAAHQTDKFIGELWDYIQHHPQYKDKTSLVITTDHGRGSYKAGEWKSHGKTYVGSDAIWMAVMGPDTEARGEVKEAMQLWQRQVAGTCMDLLDMEELLPSDRGPSILK